MMGASAVVGGSIPIAVGSALASVMEGIDRVSVAFFGESAVEEGVFHESLNFAVLKRLPIIFVCENNLYATHSHLLARQPADNISERFTAYKVSSFRTDGNDVLSIYQRAVKAVECCRRGEGPVFLECRTYRWREHVGPNYDYNLGYRTKEELESWMQRCPIKLYEKLVLEKHWMTAKQLLEIQHGVDQEIAEALAFAKESPFPEPHEIMEDVG
jgi:pyruvate dehydrogenase E1 component alpha subunit